MLSCCLFCRVPPPDARSIARLPGEGRARAARPATALHNLAWAQRERKGFSASARLARHGRPLAAATANLMYHRRTGRARRCR
ncbi:hypothetical protein PSP6_470021 [Paraburkholderia tropica]|nr:hypothetical protein PSP6_470021 [Paraburkholderia tropica]